MRSARTMALAVTAAAVLAMPWMAGTASATTGPLCGTMTATAAPQHVIIVMLENRSYSKVVGNSAAPFQNSLVRNCGVATSMWGATHTSAPNYLAVSAGQIPSTAYNGCNYSACASSETSIYQQLDAAGLTWKAYEEAMPKPCYKSQAKPYKIGHNPPIFYTGISAAECQSNDVGVASLTAQSGAFYSDLLSGALPSVAWITPDTSNDGENSCGGNCALTIADTWLQNFVALVAASAEYQSGTTAIFVTYDEGTGSDAKNGENCANQTADLAGTQPSCHIPFFVIYPGTVPGTSDGTFFDHYSLTRTVEDFFGLSHLVHAGDSQTTALVGHFGLTAPTA